MPQTKLTINGRKNVRLNSAFYLPFSTSHSFLVSLSHRGSQSFSEPGVGRWEPETEPYSKPCDSSPPNRPTYCSQTTWRSTLGMPQKRTSKISWWMNSCYCSPWKHSHRALALHALVEVFDIFSLRVLLIQIELFAEDLCGCLRWKRPSVPCLW